MRDHRGSLDPQGWFSFHYKTGKLYFLNGLASMIYKFGSGTEEEIDETKKIRSTYR